VPICIGEMLIAEQLRPGSWIAGAVRHPASRRSLSWADCTRRVVSPTTPSCTTCRVAAARQQRRARNDRRGARRRGEPHGHRARVPLPRTAPWIGAVVEARRAAVPRRPSRPHRPRRGLGGDAETRDVVRRPGSPRGEAPVSRAAGSRRLPRPDAETRRMAGGCNWWLPCIGRLEKVLAALALLLSTKRARRRPADAGRQGLGDRTTAPAAQASPWDSACPTSAGSAPPHRLAHGFSRMLAVGSRGPSTCSLSVARRRGTHARRGGPIATRRGGVGQKVALADRARPTEARC